MRSNSEKIIDSLLALEETIKNLVFNQDDIRYCFFALQNGILLNYNRGYYFLEVGENIIKNKPLQECINISPEQLYILNLMYEKTNSLNSYISYHNRNLIISSWSNFELLITTICDSVLDDEKKEELLKECLIKIKKTFKITEVSKTDKEFIKKDLSHVGMPKKCHALYKKMQIEKEKRKEDLSFLVFFGHLRNTMHSNFIYKGAEFFQYPFDGITFTFEKNKVVKYNHDDEYGPSLYLKLFDRLKEIALTISNNLNIKQIILYPDLKAQG